MMQTEGKIYKKKKTKIDKIWNEKWKTNDDDVQSTYLVNKKERRKLKPINNMQINMNNMRAALKIFE